jgi:hypothetical protein
MSKYYTFPESKLCSEKILEYFNFLVNDCKYQITSKNVDKYFVEIVYENENINRKIEIKNQTNYTDYGFSIFVYNTENISKILYEIIINIPFENQDKNCKFIEKSSEYLKTNYEKLIRRESWTKNHNSALLLYSIFSTEGDTGSELKNIIAYVDYINHAIITFKEFTDGINYLLSNGLIKEKNKKYFTDKKYKEWYENEYKNRKRIYLAKVIDKTEKYLDTIIKNNNFENIRTKINETYFDSNVNEYIK